MNGRGERCYEVRADLAEWQLLRRIRQIRASGEDVILLVRASDCREVAHLPARDEITRFNSKEKTC